MEPLILLHGALANSHQFDILKPKLQEHFDLYTLDFEGHGESGPTDSPFRIEYFVENVLGLLDEHMLEKVNIFGYSMGGYIGLTLAKEYPKSVKKVATLGTILNWDVETARWENRFLHPERLQAKVPDFVDQLNRRHLDGWERVVERTREMLQHLGKHPSIQHEEWKYFKIPIRLHVGDRDTTAGLETTMEIFEQLSNAELCVLPGTPHPFEKANIDTLTASLIDFF
ncbi:MAG TPA: alpha/beta fold hydrolase [Balneolaceae bacterium]|nr:alpha/beta fold hydrolase [Balneolaceae bacterium]